MAGIGALQVSRIEGRPAEGQRVYEPRGAALRLLYCRAPSVLIEGPSGTGKTRAALEKLHLCLLKYPGSRALLLRKSRESLTQTAIVTFERKVLPNPLAVPFHHEDQQYNYSNGSVLAVGGLDKASKVLSSEYDLIFVNEATELSLDDYEYLTTRNRNGVMPYQQIILDCNPNQPEHWLNVACDSGKIVRLVSRHEDNPAVTTEYIQTLDRLTGYRYKRLRLGLWVAAEGQFFLEWNPEVHIVPWFEIPKEWTRWTATDYGFAEFFCTLWLARANDKARSLYVYREAYARGLRDHEQAALIRSKSEGERLALQVGDPSMFNRRNEAEKPSIAQEYWSAGIPLQAASNNRSKGWQVVREVLAYDLDKGKQPRLKVLEGAAPNLCRTLPAMVHDAVDQEDLADSVRGVKTEDHAVDTLRYGLMVEAAPEKRVTRVNFGGQGDAD